MLEAERTPRMFDGEVGTEASSPLHLGYGSGIRASQAPAKSAPRALLVEPVLDPTRRSPAPLLRATEADLRLQCCSSSVSYTHLRAHETKANLVCRLLLEKKKKN